MKFYSVEYKGAFGGSGKSIVPAESRSEASKKFYDPDDPIGPRNEVKAVKSAKRIPKGWSVSFEKEGTDLITTVQVEKDISLSNGDQNITGIVLGDRRSFKLSEIIGASPTKKAHVM